MNVVFSDRRTGEQRQATLPVAVATVSAAMSASTPAQILAILGPSCRDNARRQLLLAQNVLNGIDYVEFEMVGRRRPCTSTS